MSNQADISLQLNGIKKKALGSGLSLGVIFAIFLFIQVEQQSSGLISAIVGFGIGFLIGYFGYLRRAKQRAQQREE